MTDYYNYFTAKKTGIFSKRAAGSLRLRGAIVAFMVLPLTAGCASWGAKKQSAADSASFTQSDLRSQLSKQQIIIDDLSSRITQLENLLLKQDYEIKKLKKIVKKQNIQSIELVQEEAKAEAAGDGGEAQEDTDYSIFIETGKAGGKEDDGGTNPVLKLYGNGANAGYAASSDKSDDMNALMQDAAVASSYVPLKLHPAALSAPSAAAPGFSPMKQPPAGEEAAKAQTVDPYETGIAKYKQGKWLDASLYFDVFLKNNAGSLKAPNALFLKGESLYQAGKFLEALGTFEIVESKFTTFMRIPEAKLRIGRCYEKLNDKEKAAKVYESIVQNYPKSTVAVKALKHLKELKKKK